jgi:hypothetical protein
MARMIPDQPAHKSSEAELTLFDKMKALPDDFVVLHSLGLTHHEHKRWSEIDFVVVCPDGVFLLEVKGGVVERSNGEWFVTDRDKKKESLGRGPFAQVGGAEAATRRFLRDRLPETRSMTMGYAVVTPDCILNLDGLDVDPAVCFDASNISLGLRSLLASLAMHWRSRIPAQSDRLAPELAARVVAALCSDIPGIPSIRQRVSGVLAEIHAATLEQERLLAGLHFQKRVVVRGPAGSGKSTIALNECKLRAVAGQTVVYLCHTRTFAEHLRKATAGIENLHVLSADQFPDHVRSLEPCDVLVIDEGQDTLVGLSPTDLDLALRGGIRDGSWRLLLDPFQLLDDGVDLSNLGMFENSATFAQSLDLNVRGTVEIAVTSSAFGHVDRIRGGIHGPEVKLRFPDSPSLREEVLDIVDEWISTGIDSQEILVLVPGSEIDRPDDQTAAGIGSLRIMLAKRSVRLSTPAEMKGWESSAVVYAGAHGLGTTEERREAYLACTRAQVLLAVVGHRSMQDDVPGAYAAAIAREARQNRP